MTKAAPSLCYVSSVLHLMPPCIHAVKGICCAVVWRIFSQREVATPLRPDWSAGQCSSPGVLPPVEASVMVLDLQVLKVGADGALTVKMGPLSMQTTVADVAPVTRSKASRAAAATGKLPQKKSTAQQSSQGATLSTFR